MLIEKAARGERAAYTQLGDYDDQTHVAVITSPDHRRPGWFKVSVRLFTENPHDYSAAVVRKYRSKTPAMEEHNAVVATIRLLGSVESIKRFVESNLS